MEKNKMIKYLNNFLAILIISFGINSCDSSLGYDPNVQITKINKDTTDKLPDTNTIITNYNVDSVRFVNFQEGIHRQGHDLPPHDIVNWTPRVLSKNITIDTSEVYTKLWMDLDLDSPDWDTDLKYIGVKDRVVRFKLNFSAVLNKPTFPLEDTEKNNRWFELSVKTMPDRITTFNGNQLKSQIVFMEENRDLGYIKLFLEGLSSNMMGPKMKVEKFTGFIWIYYKKI
jgi:hypothetical protein